MADRYVTTAGDDVAGTGSIGSPFATPGKALAVASAGDRIFLDSGTYLTTSASYNVPGGCLSIGDGIRFFTTGATRPIIRASGITSAILVAIANPGQRSHLRGIEIDGAGLTGVRAFLPLGGSSRFFLVEDVVIRNCAANEAVTGAQYVEFVNLFATGCSGIGVFKGNQSNFLTCVAHLNSAAGFMGDGSYERCISSKNTGDGFYMLNAYGKGTHCVSYGNGGSGFRNYGGGGRGQSFVNSIAWGNGGFAIDSQTDDMNVLKKIAYGGNTLGYKNATFGGILDTIQLTANPFVNPEAAITSVEEALAAFALNSNAGGGALCRGAGYPSNVDIGAVQHVAEAGGGGGIVRRLIKL